MGKRPDLEIYRILSAKLIKCPLQPQKAVNVLTNKLHVVSRPDRGIYCLRWRAADK